MPTSLYENFKVDVWRPGFIQSLMDANFARLTFPTTQIKIYKKLSIYKYLLYCNLFVAKLSCIFIMEVLLYIRYTIDDLRLSNRE